MTQSEVQSLRGWTRRITESSGWETLWSPVHTVQSVDGVPFAGLVAFGAKGAKNEKIVATSRTVL